MKTVRDNDHAVNWRMMYGKGLTEVCTCRVTGEHSAGGPHARTVLSWSSRISS